MCRVSRHATRSFEAHKLSPNLSLQMTIRGKIGAAIAAAPWLAGGEAGASGFALNFITPLQGAAPSPSPGCDAGWLRSAWLRCRLAALSLATGRLNGQHSPFSTAYG